MLIVFTTRQGIWLLICCSYPQDPGAIIPGISNDMSDNDIENLGSYAKRLQRAKKRLRHETTWKRNIQKVKRVKGEPYVNVAGKRISSNCQCKANCFHKLEKKAIFRDFWAMESTDLQDVYLYGNIVKLKVQRVRPRSGKFHQFRIIIIMLIIHHCIVLKRFFQARIFDRQKKTKYI